MSLTRFAVTRVLKVTSLMTYCCKCNHLQDGDCRRAEYIHAAPGTVSLPLSYVHHLAAPNCELATPYAVPMHSNTELLLICKWPCREGRQPTLWGR